MNLLYVKRFFRGVFNSKIKLIEVYGINKSSQQLYRVHIKVYGGYRIKINDYKVKWREVYVCGLYQDSFIKIDIKGLFKRTIHYESVDITPMFVNVSTLCFLDSRRPLSAKMERQSPSLRIKDINLSKGLQLIPLHEFILQKKNDLTLNKNVKLVDKHYSLINLKKKNG
ncbi:hypothetical protein [Leeuwenhoekiella marinoflava]|uniref:Uncharacterized protein n=2 Tax=Leeuwenhoekiella marinoflava TaxID=988 RepID=A0A4V1KSC5_9FLAO|nr:hypothetical protein [Leeuwenhoekiella marinoflava]RXG29870.1 hypothetical protein DSL99_1923 [Leeuwenhoekiella marinoflava]SHF27753.1 hypothetical protein SAMN02745246_02114 [Leeuwenhoekiella marinoflava DSM 3653]